MNEGTTSVKTPKESAVRGRMIRLTVGGKAYWLNIDHLISVEPSTTPYPDGTWITLVDNDGFWAAESPDEVVALVRAASPPDLSSIAMLLAAVRPAEKVSSSGSCGDSQADENVTR